jgi:hypothetical protein
VAAGAVRTIGQVSFTTAPGVLFQGVEATQEIVRLWSPATKAVFPAGQFYVAGPALADELGVRPGLFVSTLAGPVAQIAFVLDTNSRNPQAGRWLIDVVPPAGTAQECWVEFRPGSFEGGLGSLAADFATGDKEPVVRRYIERDAFARDLASELAARPQRHGWIVVGVLLVGLLAMVAWFRRADLALYLAVGTSRWELLMMLAVEVIAVSVLGWIAGFCWALAVARLAGISLSIDGTRLALETSASAALMVIVLAPVLSLAMVRGSIAGLLKDR